MAPARAFGCRQPGQARAPHSPSSSLAAANGRTVRRHYLYRHRHQYHPTVAETHVRRETNTYSVSHRAVVVFRFNYFLPRKRVFEKHRNHQYEDHEEAARKLNRISTCACVCVTLVENSPPNVRTTQPAVVVCFSYIRGIRINSVGM